MVILGGTRAERSRTSGSLINRVVFTAATIVQSRTAGLGVLQGRRYFKGLLNSLDNIVCMTFRVEPTDNLILWRHIQFWERFVKFFAQLYIFVLKSTHCRLFLLYEESEVNALILSLPDSSFPFKISPVKLFSMSYQLPVQCIVFFDKPFIFFLQGY